MCEKERVWDSPPLRCQRSPLPSQHLSPWADRGLISQLSTHFLRLSPSRSHTLLLLLPSVPFSISLPLSIILLSPSLTFMPSIYFIALLHFTSTLSFLSFTLAFLSMTITVLFFTLFQFHFWFSLFLPLFFCHNSHFRYSLSYSDEQKYTMSVPFQIPIVSSFPSSVTISFWLITLLRLCFPIIMAPAEQSVPGWLNLVFNKTMMSNWPFVATPMWLGADCLLCIAGQAGENTLINHCLNCIPITRPPVHLSEGPGSPVLYTFISPKWHNHEVSCICMKLPVWDLTCIQTHTPTTHTRTPTCVYHTCKAIKIYT